MKKNICGILLLAVIVAGVYLLLRKQTNTAYINSHLQVMSQDRNGNFVLCLTNEIVGGDTTDIKIYIDGKIAVNQKLAKPIKQPTIYPFQFSLSRGNHKIYAVSVNGEAKLEEEFEIRDTHWAAIGYWYRPPSHYDPMPEHFTFRIQDELMGFE